MDNRESDALMPAIARRLALSGAAIVGFLGVVMAVNAALSSEYPGAGLCLMAAVAAFGLIAHTSRAK